MRSAHSRWRGRCGGLGNAFDTRLQIEKRCVKTRQKNASNDAASSVARCLADEAIAVEWSGWRRRADLHELANLREHVSLTTRANDAQ
jgi:hypothetical protein